MTSSTAYSQSSWMIRVAVLGALIFVVVFALRYAMVDGDLYTVRDDGVITMSVARNLVDFGFAGVSPSGPIVGASSSPLQTATYAIAYALTGVGPEAYAFWQTYVTAALMGALFALFFSELSVARIVTASAISAFVLTLSYPFFLWHGSGMENALSHLFLLGSVFAVYDMDRRSRIVPLWGLVFLAASIARIDAVVTMTVLLVTFSVWWWRVRGTLGAFWLSVAVGLGWIAIQAIRYSHFGTILPNTAHAQGISVGERLVAALSGDRDVLVQFVRSWGGQILLHGWWVVLAALPFLKGFRPGPGVRAAIVILLVLGATSFLQALLFGPARIDGRRTTTQLTPLAVLATALIVARSDLWLRSRLRTMLLSGGVVVLLAAMVVVRPYYLGWGTSEMVMAREKFLEIAETNDLPRPLIVNPDLGMLSWKKALNIVDVGRLGSPVMAKLPTTAERADYIMEFALPDMIALRSGWARDFCADLFLDPDFDRMYRAVDAILHDFDAAADFTGDRFCAPDAGKPYIFWLRRDVQSSSGSFERRLIDRINAEGVSIDAFEAAVTGCRAEECGAAMRTAFRFMPELRTAGIDTDVIALFTDEYARAYLEGWHAPQAHERLVERFLVRD